MLSEKASEEYFNTYILFDAQSMGLQTEVVGVKSLFLR